MSGSHDPEKPSRSGSNPQFLRAALGFARELPLKRLLRPEVSRPLINGASLALIIGGGVWVLVTSHPLALAMVFLGTALYLATQTPGGP